MQLRTEVESIQSKIKISHHDTVLLIGSCFTENMGLRLQNYKFDALSNPFGILFDPYSIAYALFRIIENIPYSLDELENRNDLWHSWDHHSRFSGTESEEVLNYINISMSAFRAALKNAKALFITFGSAWHFQLVQNGRKVANCHKYADHLFDKKIGNFSDLQRLWIERLEQLKYFNPDLQVVFSVSPIRHIKNGLVDDQRSKSLLRTLCGELDAEYFPSYEILMDDLRDYRFYEDDLIHPSKKAQDYIWEIFTETYFEQETININKIIKRIQLAAAHRPMNVHSNEHQSFIEKSISNLEEVEKQLPFINFTREKNAFEMQKL